MPTLSERPNIDVVIPSYNYAPHITSAIASVLAQTTPAHRIIVVDDASSDNTPQIVEAIAKSAPIVELHRMASNGGLSAVRNHAIRLSTADLVVFLDADDWLPRHYLARCAQTLIREGVDIVYPSTHFFGSYHAHVLAVAFSANHLKQKNFIPSTAMFRRSTWQRIGDWSTELAKVGVEDWHLWLRAVDDGQKVCPAATTWVNYRRHAQSSANTSRLSWRKYLAAISSIEEVTPGLLGNRAIAANALREWRLAVPTRARRILRPQHKRPPSCPPCIEWNADLGAGGGV
jgi:cellulose synthase/poly-beta-1,6-N-acetylglucosamine synthase-like glycosyltransferase